MVVTVGHDMTARQWRIPSGEPVAIYKHDDTINQVKYLKEGDKIVIGSSSGIICIDTNTWKQIGPTLEKGNAVGFILDSSEKHACSYYKIKSMPQGTGHGRATRPFLWFK